jgi:hypothetical protein
MKLRGLLKQAIDSSSMHKSHVEILIKSNSYFNAPPEKFLSQLLKAFQLSDLIMLMMPKKKFAAKNRK